MQQQQPVYQPPLAQQQQLSSIYQQPTAQVPPTIQQTTHTAIDADYSPNSVIAPE